jgi:hypothetical protein
MRASRCTTREADLSPVNRSTPAPAYPATSRQQRGRSSMYGVEFAGRKTEALLDVLHVGKRR